MSGNIRVDILFKSVRDLQQARQGLEQKLKELRAQRSDHEATLENLSVKYNHVKDINAKMSETLKVAQYKVMETQNQLKNMEEMNVKKQQRLSHLNSQIDKEKQEQQRNVSKFENKLSALTDSFLAAKDFFTEKSLSAEISSINGSTRKAEIEIGHRGKEVDELNQKVEKLKLDGDLDTGSVPFSSGEQEFLVTELQRESERARAAMHGVQESLANLTAELAAVQEE